ncbi:MAG: hypothetical protein IT454_21860 [Planctomycetes bacterium]|nr:hypothetical protein [Planctomycetota bacterium]
MLSLILALVQAQPHAPAPRTTGLVVLLGERARDAEVPELAGGEPRLLLTAGAAASRAQPGALHLDPARRFAAEDRELCEKVRSAERIEIGNGALVDWIEVLYPRRHPTALVQALIEAHRAGRTLVGRGEAAGVLSAAAAIDDITELRGTHADPHDAEQPLAAWMLGFQPWALIDEETRATGSLERWLSVLQHDRLRLGLFLDAEAAWIIDRDSESLVARAGGVSLALDTRNARNDLQRLRDARLSMLASGDQWRARRRDAHLEGERAALASAPARQVQLQENLLELDRLVETLAALPPDSRHVTLQDARGVVIELEADELTTVAVDDAGRTRWAELRASLDWRALARR